MCKCFFPFVIVVVIKILLSFFLSLYIKETTASSYNNFCAVLTNYQLSFGNMKKVLAIINMHLYAPDYQVYRSWLKEFWPGCLVSWLIRGLLLLKMDSYRH